MHNYSISKLLGLEGVRVKNISHTDTCVKLYVTTAKKTITCPVCGNHTSKVHDYRNQTLKDLPISGKQALVILKKRRYACSCGKRFYEPYTFLPKYQRKTNRVSAMICNQMAKSIPIITIAKDLGLSPTTVSRTFDFVSYPKITRMPKVLSIDEFKGNAGNNKYQCILVDAQKKRILDILPDRRLEHLQAYFRSIPLFERQKVKYFVCDMWKQYAQIARDFFPNAKIITDKYHFIRQVTWAIENVRKRAQKDMIPSVRKYFKRSRSLIIKRNHKLSDNDKERLQNMLLYHDDLRTAYYLKEKFYDICKMDKYSLQRKAYTDWIKYAESLCIPEFKNCINALRNWHQEILHAFKYGYTNGPTEGFNNKIKVLKRVSYGFRNFNRFRNRILHTCNH